MFPLSVRNLSNCVSGRHVGQPDLTVEITGCSIDSRTLHPGDVFFALPGSVTHGHCYGRDALRRGAAVVVADETESSSLDYPHVAVDCVTRALSQLAHHNRSQSQALVIGVTGSVGKTTTRSVIASALAESFRGTQSPRNYNNHLGVPLSLLQISGDDEFAVIELGASARNELRPLAELTEPEFGVVTRITPTHLRGFESLEAIRVEKEELIRSLPPHGIAFLNADDDRVRQMKKVARCRTVTFGTADDADIRAHSIISSEGTLQLVVNDCPYFVDVCGKHNTSAILAALAIGTEVGMTPAGLQRGLSRFRGEPGRCRVSSAGSRTVIDDTYNSSPAGVAAAIELMSDFRSCHHRILVLSDMLDLGEQSPELHFGIGAAVAGSQVDHIAVCGEFRDSTVEGFLSAGGNLNRISVFSDTDHLLSLLDCITSDGDLILVKGSRGTRMERVVETLHSAYTPNLTTRRAA